MKEELTTYHDLFGKSLSVDYAKEAERWVGFVVDALKLANPAISGHSLSSREPSDSLPHWHWELTFNPALETPAIDLPHLLILPGGTNPEEIYLLLGATSKITAEHIAMWEMAIQAAVEKLRAEKRQTIQWEAVIGQLNEVGGQQHYSLKSETKVSGVTLTPGRIPYTWLSESTVPRFNSSSFNFSFPIIIKGTATGLDWQEASKEATKELNKVVGLLSIAWQSSWKVIHSPQPRSEVPLKIPTASPGMIGPSARHMHIPRKKRVIPGWFAAAFTKVDTDPILADAINMYHEGLLMEQAHPSFALLAYVASIEAIGRKLLGRKSRNKARFKAGLKTVVRTKAKLDEIASAYAPRSSTAHEAKLHGNEDLFGYVALPSAFSPEESDMFWLVYMRRIRRVSCKVLSKQLKAL